MINWADLMNWVYQNRWWYIPLHVAAGAISWAWYNFCLDRDLHKEFDQRLQELGYVPEDIDIDKLGSPLAWFLGIVSLALSIIAGPSALAAVATFGAIGFIKLKRGLKFSL